MVLVLHYKTHLDMYTKRILTVFSTLRMLDAGSPPREFGVHCLNAFTTTGTATGRSLMRLAQLLSKADKRSIFLRKALKEKYKVHWSAHWLEYNRVMEPSISFRPSASNSATLIKG